jgi:hypothetical protein
LIGRLDGAVYAGVIAVLILPANEISLLIALAIAVAPLALLAAINTNLRVGPYTAVLMSESGVATDYCCPPSGPKMNRSRPAQIHRQRNQDSKSSGVPQAAGVSLFSVS